HSGVHGANNARVYAEDIVGRANQVFAAAPVTAPTFSYRTADKDFSVWDYKVSTNRSVALEDARRDGRAFSLRGHGTAHVSTPPTFTAGSAYQVTISSANRQSVTADSTGRLQLTVPLNSGHASVSIGS
ncbi:hypothetical protein, partial [Allokutzneria sp. NRRL B-24872]|uniref:hypothetical protein n=1 Tax=Allokutzneria sp. NRRL B-24872 TaxID=1137961 RepID=UPI00143D5B8B